jgi:hypothetical protein
MLPCYILARSSLINTETEYKQQNPPFVILSVAKNLVLHRDVTAFLWYRVTKRKVLFGCCWTRFFATLRMTKGELVLEFNGLTTQLILRCAQNDKGWG